MKRSLIFFLILTVGLAMSFALSTGDVSAATKKAKKITLKASAKTVTAGKTVTIKVTKVSPKKASKKVTWKITKGAKYAKLTKKKGTSVVVKALKPGSVTIKASAKKGKAKKTITIKIKAKPAPPIPEKQLKKFGITGYYVDGIDTINTVPLDQTLKVSVWDPATDKFVAGTTADINGNYTALYDTDANDAADRVEVVKFADGPKKWNAETRWLPGAGDAVGMPDAVGEQIFGAENRIPYGERLFTEFGLGAYSGATDWANVEESPCWENTHADFYHQGSTDTLTMLTGYRTDLQTSGSLCVMSSSTTVLDWYEQRGDLTENDLALLRGNDCTERRGTSLTQTIQLFRKLGELGLTCEWDMQTYYDFDGDPMDSDWIRSELAKGHPIIVIWNSFGAHGQVIIGYDTMGTSDTLDDVCIMMDPYDTTDHNNDGYIIQPFERLQYGKLTWSDDGTTGVKYMSVWPKDPKYWDDSYRPAIGEPLTRNTEEIGVFTDDNKIPYRRTADDIQAFYPDTLYVGDNGLAGAATGGYERSGDHPDSPYFTLHDYYNMQSGKTLRILNNFKTIQQSTEWTCGTASALMNIEWFGKNEKRTGDDPGAGFEETDVSLASHRQIPDGETIGEVNATSKEGMEEVFDYMTDQYDQDWTIFTNDDLDDPEGDESYIGDYCLQAGSEDPSWPGLIPYLIDKGIPMMIGSDEWGGHWQVIIGYDSMGTEGTQDDVLIIADPYDTTDHNQDGYVIKGFERLVYGWGSSFEEEFDGTTHNDFIVAFPTDEYADVISDLELE